MATNQEWPLMAQVRYTTFTLRIFPIILPPQIIIHLSYFDLKIPQSSSQSQPSNSHSIFSFLGKIYLNEYTNEENTKKAKQKCHNNESVRSLEFNNTGSSLISGGADKSFQIMDTVR